MAYRYSVINILVLLFVLFFSLTAQANYQKFSPSQFSQNKEVVIEAWNSKEGINRLEQSKYKGDFYKLANFYQPQINPLYCGMASSVIVLNALKSEKEKVSQSQLEIKIPKGFGGGRAEFKSYSQLTFLNKNTDKIKKRKVIELRNIDEHRSKIDPGLTLKQLSDILGQSYGIKTQFKHIKTSSNKEINEFKKVLKYILNNDVKFILANFNGKTIGLRTGGHISPLVAYDEISDSILVLDVAGHKNPWYWVKTEHLLKAMNTKDGDKFRGYVLVQN